MRLYAESYYPVGKIAIRAACRSVFFWPYGTVFWVLN